VSFVARHQPLAIVPVAILFGGFGAPAACCSGAWACPMPACRCCWASAFVLHPGQRGAARPVAAELFSIRRPMPGHCGGCSMTGMAWFDVLLAVLGGAIRVGTPFLFVSLGECLTEKAGRINLGLEGVLVFSAMAGFGGQLPHRLALAGRAGRRVQRRAAGPAARPGVQLPRVNDIATGIALMLLAPAWPSTWASR
jgi:hypothetical protein